MLKHPDHPWSPHFYVWNVLPGPDGRDYAFAWSGDTIGKPYPVEYGAVALGSPVDRWGPGSK